MSKRIRVATEVVLGFAVGAEADSRLEDCEWIGKLGVMWMGSTNGKKFL